MPRLDRLSELQRKSSLAHPSLYMEARMQQKPGASFQELNSWLWSETALSNLLRGVRDRLRSHGDPKLDAIAYGIAR